MTDTQDSVRERLVNVTIDLIDESGVDGVRLRDVMERSGVTNGSLYWEFTNRQALIDAALAERYVRRLAAVTEIALDHVETGSDFDGTTLIEPILRAFDPDVEDRSALRAERVTVLAAALRDERLGVEVGRVQQTQIERLTTVITGLQEQGRLTSDVPARSIALLVQVVVIGLAGLDLPGPDVDADWRHMVQFIVGHLRVR